MSIPADDRSAADALLEQARELDRLEALLVYDQVVARFGDSSDADVQERVAMALLRKGLALDKLGRHEDEIRAYDELLRRYAGTDHPDTLQHVAWALYDKAATLQDLEREAEARASYRDIVDRFRDSAAPQIRPRVSWAVWRLYDLGDYDEAEVCRELVARGDDELDPELRDRVLFAYQTLAALADKAGEPSEALHLIDTVLERADDTDPTECVYVSSALVWKAYLLDRLARHDEAIEAYDEVIPRLDRDGQTESAIDARRRKADATDKAGRSVEALRAYDDTLSLLADATEPPLHGQAFQLLVGKGLTLRRLRRREEALVVFGSAINAYRRLDAKTAAETRDTVVHALMEKAQLLCELGRSDEVHDVETELIALLGDVTPPATPIRVAKPTDAEVAALLADLQASECWTVFESPPEDAAAQFEATALELYRRTDPLLQAPLEEWDFAVAAAAAFIRQLADGFALLSEPLGATQLALPQRRVVEWAIRHAGLDEWASELGHPLSLDDSSDDIQDLLDEHPEPRDDRADDCAVACVAALHRRDMLAALCDSQAGQDALHTDTHRWLAARQLNTARSWGSWAFIHDQDAQPATAAAILIAQAHYRATRETLPSAAFTPTTETLRDLLHHADGIKWLTNRDLVLPAWLDN